MLTTRDNQKRLSPKKNYLVKICCRKLLMRQRLWVRMASLI